MVEPPALPVGLTLQVWRRVGESLTPVYETGGKWLHPLFGLEAHLGTHPEADPSTLVLRDRIVGRAAAFLIVGLGIEQVWTDLASLRARALFESRGLVLHARRWVEKIDCLTEELLAEVQDPVQARALLEVRRKAALNRAKDPQSA